MQVGKLNAVENTERNQHKRKISQSRALAALSITAVLNLTISTIYQPSIEEKLASFPKSEPIYTIEGYFKRPDVDILLFGSSLMKRVVCSGDAAFLNEPIDAKRHRHSAHLERRLQDLTGYPVRTCSLSMGGCFPSDAWMLASTITPSPRTKLVIYGVTPRDFSNTNLKTAASTLPFKLFSFLEPGVATDECLYSSPEEKIDFYTQQALAKAVPLFAYRTAAVETLNRKIDWCLPSYSQKLSRDTSNSSTMEASIIDPTRESSIPFSDNSEEFRRTYNPFNSQMFKAQTHFLDKFVQRFTSRKIAVVLVNMPITEGKVAPISKMDYNRYLKAVTLVAQRYDVVFLDMNSSAFTHADFRDCVHLNGRGGMKFIKLLSTRLATSKAIHVLKENRPTYARRS